MTNGIIEVLRAVGFAKSNREARRLIEQGAVKLDGVQVESTDMLIVLAPGESKVLQVGKRRFVKLI